MDPILHARTNDTRPSDACGAGLVDVVTQHLASAVAAGVVDEKPVVASLNVAVLQAVGPIGVERLTSRRI